MVYLKVSAINRGQTKAHDILAIYPDGLFLVQKQDSWFKVNYAIKIDKTVGEVKALLTKPTEDKNSNVIGDKKRWKVKFGALALTQTEKDLILSDKSKSPVPNTLYNFSDVLEDKEAV